jgi:acetyl-CoA synthetase
MSFENKADVYDQIHAWLAQYGSSQVCPARLLCDDHDPQALAYTVVAKDLSSVDFRYGDLAAESARFSSMLANLGIGPGDRVATLMTKSRAYLSALMGIWRLGAVHVPLFTAFASPAIMFRLQESGAKAVLCDEAQQDKLAPSDDACIIITTSPPERALQNSMSLEALLPSQHPQVDAATLSGDDPLIQIYTSGTTGKPKGVIVPVRALASFRTYAEYGLGLGPSDMFWNAADPGWAYGLYFGILSTLATGVPSILYEGGFSPDATLEILTRYGVTNFAAAPTVYRSLRGAGLTPSGPLKLQSASSAGEPLTPEINEWATNILGAEVHDHYGQTETGMLINNHQHPALRHPLKATSMGHVMPGWSGVILKANSDEIETEGQIGRVAMDLQQSPLAWFKGYVNDADRSAEKFTGDGRYYLTGDIGRMDSDRYFYFSSRDDDVIIMAGYRIGPSEIESVLLTHPAVVDCAAIAIPDDVRGEVLVAVVVLAQGHKPSDLLTQQLQAWVKSNYAAHAYPRRILYVESLPKTPSGKVQRFTLRERFRQLSGNGSAA